jgi:ribosomal protein S24E
MKIDVVEKKENPFLKRTDLMLGVDHSGKATPNRDELEKMIAKKYKSIPEKVEIVYIFSEAGLSRSKVKARIWKEKAPEKKVRKKKPKKEKPPEPKPEEKKEEKPAEEKKEEKPTEEKPKEEAKSKEKKEDRPKEEAKPEKVKSKEEGEKK